MGIFDKVRSTLANFFGGGGRKSRSEFPSEDEYDRREDESVEEEVDEESVEEEETDDEEEIDVDDHPSPAGPSPRIDNKTRSDADKDNQSEETEDAEEEVEEQDTGNQIISPPSRTTSPYKSSQPTADIVPTDRIIYQARLKTLPTSPAPVQVARVSTPKYVPRVREDAQSIGTNVVRSTPRSIEGKMSKGGDVTGIDVATIRSDVRSSPAIEQHGNSATSTSSDSNAKVPAAIVEGDVEMVIDEVDADDRDQAEPIEPAKATSPIIMKTQPAPRMVQASPSVSPTSPPPAPAITKQVEQQVSTETAAVEMETEQEPDLIMIDDDEDVSPKVAEAAASKPVASAGTSKVAADPRPQQETTTTIDLTTTTTTTSPSSTTTSSDLAADNPFQDLPDPELHPIRKSSKSNKPFSFPRAPAYAHQDVVARPYKEWQHSAPLPRKRGRASLEAERQEEERVQGVVNGGRVDGGKKKKVNGNGSAVGAVGGVNASAHAHAFGSGSGSKRSMDVDRAGTTGTTKHAQTQRSAAVSVSIKTTTTGMGTGALKRSLSNGKGKGREVAAESSKRVQEEPERQAGVKRARPSSTSGSIEVDDRAGRAGKSSTSR
ncbi:hypothetical protein HK102_002913 [Quaeritorhiza haematococci]|nr:hypothetical protein HK102_002913 [Quaeritorhiza haematococci]